MTQRMNEKIRLISKFLIIILLTSLIFSVLVVNNADARGISKKSSTADIRSQLKESVKKQVEITGACTNYCQVDHKIPLKCGGSNDVSNLQSLPQNIHEEKTAREAKLCTVEHPELTCGGLSYESIDGFFLYICSNAASASSYSATHPISNKKTSSISTSSTSSYTSGGNTGKQCYINGYTTKKGTYVHGYYRRC